MSTDVVMERIAEASPRFKARMAGVFYVLTGAAYVFGQIFILGKLVVHGNAAATANNILAHEPLFRLGFAAAIISVACSIVMTILFYDLFKPVNRSLSLLAASFHLVGLAIAAFASLLQLAPLVVLRGEQYLSIFKVEQLQALALVSLKLNGQAYDIFLVFFGFWCVLIGYLILRSTFLPRILGVLLAIDGLGWMTFLSPPLAHHLFPFIATASGLAEIPLILWLLAFGVNAQRWNEQASAAAVRA
jgi:hypothetical protein